MHVLETFICPRASGATESDTAADVPAGGHDFAEKAQSFSLPVSMLQKNSWVSDRREQIRVSDIQISFLWLFFLAQNNLCALSSPDIHKKKGGYQCAAEIHIHVLISFRVGSHLERKHAHISGYSFI